MNTQNDKPGRNIKVSDLLTLTNSIIAILVTAIIYFEGWTYAASWYGFFNIDMSQVALPTPVILINGIPAIFVALFVLGLSIIITRAINIYHRPKLSWPDMPVLAISSAVLFAITIFLFQIFLYPIVLLETQVVNGIIKYKPGLVKNVNITSLGVSNAELLGALILIFFILLFLILAQLIVAKSPAQSPRSTRKIPLLMFKLSQRLSQSKRVQKFSQRWQLGGIILLLVYLFMPMTFSAEIGKMDALRGRHLMSGSHLLPSVEIFSDSPIPGMQKIVKDADIPGEYHYGPLLLVYSDSNTYYLADNIPGGQTYYDSPKTYYVKRTSNNNIIYIVKSKISSLSETLNVMLTIINPHQTTFTPTPAGP